MNALAKVISLSIFILLFSSCGREYDSEGDQGVRFGQRMNIQERVLNPFERNIALRICESYRSKWVEFRLNKLDQNFSYKYKANLCNANVNEIDPFETKLIKYSPEEDAPLVFNTSSFVNYVQYMQTHMHGELRMICEPLMTRGETPQVSFQKEDKVIQFSFKEEGGHDFYTMYTIEKRETRDGEMHDEVVAQDKYKVLTRPESGQSELKGLVIFSERIRPCSTESPQDRAVFTQEFKN